MARCLTILLFILSVLCLCSAFADHHDSSPPLKTYIIHVRLPPALVSSPMDDVESFYHSFLPKVSATGKNDVSRMIHSYRNVFTGFAAKLSSEELKAVANMEGFLQARPEAIWLKQTTHTPQFMSLYPDHGVWPRSSFGEGVVIGMIDGGIKSDHPSFADAGMPLPPPTWKGRSCDLNRTSTCNNKLIGVKNLIHPGEPVDVDDHGTHTSSTAAGAPVGLADVLGNANGTAVGIAPLAHLAMYQVCYSIVCFDNEIAAGLEAAISDGVDVLSISLGGGGIGVPFNNDVIAIGAFRAMQRGIFVSCAAGNFGPWPGSLSNEAPWILTVGASTVDRNVRATALLGNNDTFDGESLFLPRDFPPTLLPLVYPGWNGDESTARCLKLDGEDVRGKIVICDGDEENNGVLKGEVVKKAGGAGMILVNSKSRAYSIAAEAHVLPATELSFEAGVKIKNYYINSSGTSPPTATILFKGTVLGVKTAPAVVSLSSRGPNQVSPGILKPDIVGPGLNIVAAWPSADLERTGGRHLDFFADSGTSMATPHLSGVAALLKQLHPEWSPAAIKSAIVTTGTTLNLNHTLILDQDSMLTADVFATGGGHVNPERAADPGLIYDIQPDDYVGFLCGLNYTDTQVEIIVNRTTACANISNIPQGQLNYPSFAVHDLGPYTQSYTRTVTNVGEARRTYVVEVEQIPGVDVYPDPDTLIFTDDIHDLTYTVHFTRSSSGSTAPIDQTGPCYVQGAITWISGNYRVRSPISVKLI